MKYEIEVDGQAFEVDSPSELSPQQIRSYADKFRLGTPAGRPARGRMADSTTNAPARTAVQPPAEDPLLDRAIRGGLNSIGQGVVDYGLRPLGWAATQTLDRFIGAPMRAGISAAQDVATANPEASTLTQVPEGLLAALMAGLGQFGTDPTQAPTSKELFERAGLSGHGQPMPVGWSPYSGMIPGYHESTRGTVEGPSPAALAGLGLDIVTPVPGAGAVKAAGGLGANAMRAVGGPIGLGVSAGAEGLAKAADVATGTKIGTGTADAVRAAVEAARGKADQIGQGVRAIYGKAPSKDWDRWRRVAEENGIDPETLPDSFKFGKNSIASRLERYDAQDDILGEALRDRWQGAWNNIQDALGRKVDKIAGGPGIGYGGASEAGNLIRKTYDQEVDRIFSNLENTYRSVAERHPRMVLPQASKQRLELDLQRVESYARDLATNSADGLSKAQGRELLDVVANIRAKASNYSEFVTAMQGIGRSAFKNYANSGAISPPDVSKLRQLYHAMSETAVDAVRRQLDVETAESLKINNAMVSEVLGDKHILRRMGMKDLDDSKLFANLTSDPLKIQALKKYLDPGTLKASKAAYLRELLTDKVNGEGMLSFKQLHNALRNRRHSLHALFEPDELAELRDLVEMGSSLQPMMLSTSGTGSTIQTKGLLSRVGSKLTAPLETAGHLVDEALAGRQRAGARAALDPSNTPALPDLGAAPGGDVPPVMGFAPGSVDLQRLLEFYGPRKKVAHVYGQQQQQKEKDRR